MERMDRLRWLASRHGLNTGTQESELLRAAPALFALLDAYNAYVSAWHSCDAAFRECSRRAVVTPATRESCDAYRSACDRHTTRIVALSAARDTLNAYRAAFDLPPIGRCDPHANDNAKGGV